MFTTENKQDHTTDKNPKQGSLPPLLPASLPCSLDLPRHQDMFQTFCLHKRERETKMYTPIPELPIHCTHINHTQHKQTPIILYTYRTTPQTHPACLSPSSRVHTNSAELHFSVTSSLRSMTLSTKSAVLLIRSPAKIPRRGRDSKVGSTATHPICLQASRTDWTRVWQLHWWHKLSFWYIMVSANSAVLWRRSSANRFWWQHRGGKIWGLVLLIFLDSQRFGNVVVRFTFCISTI